MMMTLTATTWARFLIWFVLGLIVYFVYGIRNSIENPRNKNNNTDILFSNIQRVQDESIVKQPAIKEFTEM
jgi:hypothetical protein